VAGHVIRPARSWLALAATLGGLGLYLLSHHNFLGFAAELAAMCYAGVQIVRRPRTRTKARIGVTADQLLLDGRPAVRLEDLVGVSTVATPNGPLVSLTDRARRTVDLLVDSDAHVAELRTALGFGFARASARSFRGHVPLGCVGSAFAAFGALASALYAAAALDYYPIVVMGSVVPALLMGVPLLFGRFQKVVVTTGGEGVHIANLLRSRLVQYSQITAVDRGTYGPVVTLKTADRSFSFELASTEDAIALVSDVRARAALPDPERDENVGGLLARGERSTAEWLETIRKQAAPGAESYRVAHLAEDRLWAVLEDPAADPTSRVGAAVALRAQASGAPRSPALEQRVRIVASGTAFPQVRIALEEVVDATDDEEVVARVKRALP
jgi:hypothetical protein